MPAPNIYADSVVPVVGDGFGLEYTDEAVAALRGLEPDKLNEFAMMQANDPVSFGWCLPGWAKVLDSWRKSQIGIILGGNRSSKSVFCARVAIWIATNVPGARVRCWSANEETSINDQQRVLWRELPERYKHLPKKRFATYSVDYTQKNGFTGGKLVFPPITPGYEGGEIIFQTYKSWANDDKVAEGWWAHFIWADEEIPPKLYETLQYRLRDVNGRMFVSFTTINGWTATVNSILNKAKTLTKRYAPLVKRELPVLQKGDEAGRTMIYYFWTQDNAFLPDSVRNGADMVGKAEHEILARQYGVPTKAKLSKFPLFQRDVHVVKHETIPVLKNPESYTWITAMDPAGSKPWSMLWGAFDAANRLWITHDWPDCATYGDWIDLSSSDGSKNGPAAADNGYGTKDYVDLITQIEKEIGIRTELVNRVIDPRYGASQTQGENGAETTISKLDDHGLTYIPAPGKQVEDGEHLINDRLSYDRTKPLGMDNAPMIYISDRCLNLIQCLEAYARTGRDEPAKDFVDALRYLLQSGIEYVNPDDKVVTGGGSY